MKRYLQKAKIPRIGRLFAGLLIICWTFKSSFGQTREIRGKVTGADDGSAIPGVSILIKGTTSGTATDATGNYRIHCNLRQCYAGVFLHWLCQPGNSSR